MEDAWAACQPEGKSNKSVHFRTCPLQVPTAHVSWFQNVPCFQMHVEQRTLHPNSSQLRTWYVQHESCRVGAIFTAWPPPPHCPTVQSSCWETESLSKRFGRTKVLKQAWSYSSGSQDTLANVNLKAQWSILESWWLRSAEHDTLFGCSLVAKWVALSRGPTCGLQWSMT